MGPRCVLRIKDQKMAKISWKSGPVPEGMRITQVYGIILDRAGRVMLRAEKKTEGIKYSLGGGRPEPYDAGIEDTCRRELLEEVNTEIEKPVYIGYQLVDEENGTPQYAQVRMAAMIRRIGEKQPDPDNGKTYDRLMVSPERAAILLQWGNVGYEQIMRARDIVFMQYGIKKSDSTEEWV